MPFFRNPFFTSSPSPSPSVSETSPLLDEAPKAAGSIAPASYQAPGADPNAPFRDPTSVLGDLEDPSTMATLKKMSSLSWPTVTTFILELMPGFVNVVAVGHLGEAELASVSLAAMFCNVTGFTVGFGIATAMDTLCSQAFGAGNKKGLGVIMQRALAVEFLISLPICVLWLFAEPLLLALGQTPEVARLSGIYCQVMIPGLFPLFVYEILKKYLQAQGVVLPQMFIAIFSNGWSVFANWLFVYAMAMGYVGAPLARMTTNCMLPILTILYLIIFKKYKGTWSGWSREAFTNWGQFLSLGIPGMLMLCLEWWAFELLAILAGLLGTTELAAQSIVYNVVLLTFFIPYGISVASSILIGNSLGKGWSKCARKTTRVSLCLAVGVELVSATFLITLRDYIPLIFTNEQEVIEMASSIIPIAAGYQIFDGLATVSGGILRGCGKQKIGAICNFVGYVLIGLSSSAALAFLADMGIIGLWVGVAISLFAVAVIAVTIVLRLNWDKEVEIAKDRLAMNFSFH